jgi:hypothetical protein
MRMLGRLLGRRVDVGEITGDGSDNPVEGYCFRCRAKTHIDGAVQVWMTHERARIRGTCATCGANMSKMGRMAA